MNAPLLMELDGTVKMENILGFKLNPQQVLVEKEDQIKSCFDKTTRQSKLKEAETQKKGRMQAEEFIKKMKIEEEERRLKYKQMEQTKQTELMISIEEKIEHQQELREMAANDKRQKAIEELWAQQARKDK